uniref:cysteine--tRNA ligase n=1 Tax=Chenopodium quinoa TaxID=63459 RepID=A0A803MYN1_CHEQI
MAEENVKSNDRPTFMLYNSMTKQKEVFKTKVPNKVSMYVCGVTAYDFSHIGHARAYVAFDVLYRYLKELDYEVTYVRNFTDVDDKIIRRANERKEKDPEDPLSDPLMLSNHFCEEFLKDMDDLQCLLPTHQPRVSDHMDQIRDMIAKIIEKGYAYPLDGDVYFAADKFPNYGKLSRRKLEDNRAGERVAVDSRKRHPADFALWKAAKPGEPSWDSPWGPGRPGWHIECSAMSAHYLTFSFDIHGGGMDLIFPHHENELAQSCAACEETDIGYWLHNGFVTINEEKMSKSTGNFFTIREVTKQYHPLALRYFLLSMNYNSPVNYSLSQLDIASDAVFFVYQANSVPIAIGFGNENLNQNYQTLLDCRNAILSFDSGNSNDKPKSNTKQPSKPSEAKNLKTDFECKMADDLHTAEILKGSLQHALTAINNELNGLKKKQKQQKMLAVQALKELEEAVTKVLDILGLLSTLPYSEVLQQLKEKALIRAELTEDEVSRLIEERAAARKIKDFTKTDQLRSELTAKGISLMDLPTGGTVWRPCQPK